MTLGTDVFQEVLPPSHRAGLASERLLLDATERALRAPKGKLAMALHLSRLKNPGRRPYHSRIALALMQDTAQRLGGQVFPMRNTDLVLLCATPEGDDRFGRPTNGFTLPDSLERLFGADAPDAALTSTWRLDQSPAAFRDYISQRQAEPAGLDGPAVDQMEAGGLAAALDRLMRGDAGGVLMQQTAIRLRPGRGLPVSSRLSPVFRDVQLNPAALGAEQALLADPFLRRHVETALDGRVIAHVLADLLARGPLTRPGLMLDMPLHLKLAPDAVISPGFARLAQAAGAAGLRLAVECQAMDVAAEPALASFAAGLLQQAGFGLVLGGIDHAGLAMIDPAALSPSLIKLAWSPRLADAPPALMAPVEAALARIGAGRIVLQDADSEAALVWAQAHGIAQFQGPYLDAVQAASRIAICQCARACTLRQCTLRAVVLDPVQRAGCGNPGLLDVNPP
jgi:hypothetical protein